MVQLHHMVAVSSGCFAALASVVGKFTFGDSFYVLIDHTDKLGALHIIQWISFVNVSPVILYQWGVWLVLLTLLLLCNILMWFAFSKAMMLSPTTVEVTALNSASNFLVSSLLGVWLFNERLSLLWLFGVLLIGVGLLVVHHVPGEGEDKHKIS